VGEKKNYSESFIFVKFSHVNFLKRLIGLKKN
jgi:hypothetical protein